MAEHHHVGALGHLGVRAERLAAELGRQRLGALAASTSDTSTGSPMPRASADAMFPAPMSPSFIAAPSCEL